MSYTIFIALFAISFVAGFGCGSNMQKCRTLGIIHRMKRLHKEQLTKARIRAKLHGCQIGRMSARATIMPTISALAGAMRK